MPKRRSQLAHDRMVKALADALVEKGFRYVKAHVAGFDTPERIYWLETGRGHIPDVTGRKVVSTVFEVETADSIGDVHTRDQWTLFAAYAAQHKALFCVVVPKGFKETARKRLVELGIAAELLGI